MMSLICTQAERQAAYHGAECWPCRGQDRTTVVKEPEQKTVQPNVGQYRLENSYLVDPSCFILRGLG
jgi:hypothetical protein